VDGLGELAAKVAGQAVPKPFGPVIEELTRALLGVQDKQLQLLQHLQQDVQGLRQDIDRLLQAHWHAARGFLERAAISGRDPKAKRKDLREASNEFIRAAGVYPQPSLARAAIYSQLSITLGLLNDAEAARRYAGKAWSDAIRCLYLEVTRANSQLLSYRKRRFLQSNGPEIGHLQTISALVAELREVVVRFTPTPPAASSPRRGRGSPQPRTRTLRAPYSRRPIDCLPYYSVVVGYPVSVEKAYSSLCIRSRARLISRSAGRHGLAGKVYGLASATHDKRLYAGLVVPTGDDGRSSQAFRDEVQRYFRWGIDVQFWHPWDLEAYEPIA
jgi:hypothetical protein